MVILVPDPNGGPPTKLYLNKLNTYEAWELTIEGYNYIKETTKGIADNEIVDSGGVSSSWIDCGQF